MNTRNAIIKIGWAIGMGMVLPGIFVIQIGVQSVLRFWPFYAVLFAIGFVYELIAQYREERTRRVDC
jgi:hypothetical protein